MFLPSQSRDIVSLGKVLHPQMLNASLDSGENEYQVG